MFTEKTKGKEALRLRAHHICCLPWLKSFVERGAAYLQAERQIKNILFLQLDYEVKVIEGVDELCRYCPLCVDGRCASPLGSEEEVRKWDAVLLKELSVSSGTCLTAGEWHTRVKQKAPFQICRKCRWQKNCQIGAKLK